MKKNKMMRTASGLMVAALLTTSIISGTFAKYTTKTEGSDTARVAYWGFNQDANTTIDLFDNSYNEGKVSGAENVVAPGTSKTADFGFKYTANANKSIKAPEVAYNLKIEATATGDYTDLDENSNFKWTLKSGAADSTTEYDKVADLVKAINNLSGSEDGSGSKDYAAGELPAAFGTADTNKVCTVGWKWEYDGNDTKDTEMGNATKLDNVKLNISITATQSK